MTHASKALAKPYKIKLDKERLLVLDFNAFCELERRIEETRIGEVKTQISDTVRKELSEFAKKVSQESNNAQAVTTFLNTIAQVLNFIESKRLNLANEINFMSPTMRDMRLLLWGSLLRHNPDITSEEEAGALIHMGNLPLIQKAITYLLQTNEPPLVEETAEEKKRDKASAKKKSSKNTSK